MEPYSPLLTTIRFATVVFLLGVNAYALVWFVAHEIQAWWKIIRPTPKLHPPLGNVSKWVLVVMAAVHRLKERFGYLPFLIVVFLLAAQGSLLLRLVALGALVTGAAVHRLSLGHRPLLEYVVKNNPKLLTGHVAPQLPLAATSVEPAPDVFNAPRKLKWRPQRGAGEETLFKPWQVVVGLVVVNGVLYWILSH